MSSASKTTVPVPDQRQAPDQHEVPDPGRPQAPDERQAPDQRQALDQHEVPDLGRSARWNIQPAGTGTMEHRAGPEPEAGPGRWRWLASGVLQTVNSLGMSLGIAGIGAIFFALAGGHGGHVPVYLRAAEWTALATAGLLACSFAVAFALPQRARER
jgi:hypothetical protein